MLTIRRLSSTKLLSEGAWCGAIALAGIVGGLLVSPLAHPGQVHAGTAQPAAASPLDWTYTPAGFSAQDQFLAVALQAQAGPFETMDAGFLAAVPPNH